MFKGHTYDKETLMVFANELSPYKLAQLIGKDPSTIIKWLTRNPDKTIEDYIDMICKIDTKSYKGYTWTSINSLAKQLEISPGCIFKFLNDNPGKTEIDFIDMKNELEVKNRYRGYEWKTYTELSVKLGKDKTYVSAWLHNHKPKNVYQCIDFVILNSPNQYKGFSWISARDLSLQMGKGSNCISSWLRVHPDKTIEDYIDMYQDNIHEYRGIYWTTDRDLSIKLGKNRESVGFWIRRNKNKKTREDYIDLCLGDLTYDEFKIEKGIV